MERCESKKLSLFVCLHAIRVLEGWTECTVPPPNAFVAQDTAEVMKIATFLCHFLFNAIYPRFLLFFDVFSRFGSIIGVGTHPKLFHTIFSNLGTMVHPKKLDPKLKIRISRDILTNVGKKIEFPWVLNILTRGHPGVNPGSPGGKPGVSPGSPRG